MIGANPDSALTVASWQDVECGGYGADLPRLRELARAAGGLVAELGAGAGRVALDLAGAGVDVLAIESDAELASVLQRRARERGLAGRVTVLVSDAAEADVEPGTVALLLAPMQFLHLLSPSARGTLLDRARPWLRHGGRLAAVVLADPAEAISGSPDDAPPLPDVREVEGWVLSSLPLAVRIEPGRIEVDRLRQAVSPAGELTETRSTDVLWELSADGLAAEAAERGFTELAREPVPGDELHVDSVLITLGLA